MSSLRRLSTSTVALLAVLAGCGSTTDQRADEDKTPPTAREDVPAPTPVVLKACEAVFNGGSQPTTDDEIVAVVDPSASVTDQPMPDGLAAGIRDLSVRGGTITVISVDGRGAAPTILAKHVPLGPPGPRDTRTVEDFAQLAPSCVRGMYFDAAASSKPGTDLYRAHALAAELVTTHTQEIWSLTDLVSTTGQFALTDTLLNEAPSTAAAMVAESAPLSLGKTRWHIGGLANTSTALQPSSRSWMQDFAQTLCREWNATGCRQIKLDPENPVRSGRASKLEDPLPAFPRVTSVAQGDACTYTIPAVLTFAGDSAELAHGAERAVAEPLEQLSTSSDARVRIVGHSASSSAYSATALKRLSAARAEAVAGIFADAGIGASRIETAGVGDTDPLVEDIDPKTGRQLPAAAAKERRVSITVDAPCSL